MKGVSEVIAEILIVAMAVGLMSVFYLYYTNSSQEAMQNVEQQGKDQDCERNANFMITEINGSTVYIKNLGGTNINSSGFTGYINDTPVQISVVGMILKPGDNITLQLNQAPGLGSSVKIMGDCKLGDEFYVK
jgi:archaellum component FlaF (FlaF/FlaG flagellin family)